MGECKLDHSYQDVVQKLNQQEAFLPVELHQGLKKLLQPDLQQALLNEIFHLLKKYDLAEKEEQECRNEQIQLLITKERE